MSNNFFGIQLDAIELAYNTDTYFAFDYAANYGSKYQSTLEAFTISNSTYLVPNQSGVYSISVQCNFNEDVQMGNSEESWLKLEAGNQQARRSAENWTGVGDAQFTVSIPQVYLEEGEFVRIHMYHSDPSQNYTVYQPQMQIALLGADTAPDDHITGVTNVWSGRRSGAWNPTDDAWSSTDIFQSGSIAGTTRAFQHRTDTGNDMRIDTNGLFMFFHQSAGIGSEPNSGWIHYITRGGYSHYNTGNATIQDEGLVWFNDGQSFVYSQYAPQGQSPTYTNRFFYLLWLSDQGSGYPIASNNTYVALELAGSGNQWRAANTTYNVDYSSVQDHNGNSSMVTGGTSTYFNEDGTYVVYAVPSMRTASGNSTFGNWWYMNLYSSAGTNKVCQSDWKNLRNPKNMSSSGGCVLNVSSGDFVRVYIRGSGAWYEDRDLSRLYIAKFTQ